MIDVGNDQRDYDSFAVMANVTSQQIWPLISKPRGLPEDFFVFNEYTHYQQWMGDHSHSYLLLSEINIFMRSRVIKNKLKDSIRHPPFFYLSDVRKDLGYLTKKYSVSDNHVRIVFGFDS